jgi:EAL and modified HD-GYP domain-containing signal transduction protein
MTVLEILETLEPTPSLVAACCKLKASGFRLALDDFVWAPKFAPLVQLANYIKVDFRLTGRAERRRLLGRLRDKAIAMLAEKVETQEEYLQACEEGFTLFQGYYFCRPVLMKNRKIPANRLFQLEILQLMRGGDMDLRKVTEMVKRDASLTHRVLRLVNSAAFAVRQEVSSIQTALMLVGEVTFRRIATLAITSELSAGQPTEVLRMAFVRGRFCEVGAGLCGLDPTEQYLLGLLSMLPPMLQLSMEELTPALPLRGAIREALNGKVNQERSLLQWLERHEDGDWAACDAVAKANCLNQEDLVAGYAKAVVWAEAALRPA